MAKKVWDKDGVIEAVRTAIATDYYMDKALRQAVANSWPSTCSFSYEWLHRLTEDAAPLSGLVDKIHEGAAVTNADTLSIVAMRWLDWLDSVDDRKIVWWCAGNVTQADIGRRLGLTYPTTHNRYEAAIEQIVKKLNASDSN